MAAERRTRFVRRADHLRALQPLVQHLACRLVLRPVVVRETEVAGLREVPIARPAPRQPRLRAAPDVSSDREHGAAGERPAQIWRRGLTFCFCGERLLVVIAAGRGCYRGVGLMCVVVPYAGPTACSGSCLAPEARSSSESMPRGGRRRKLWFCALDSRCNRTTHRQRALFRGRCANRNTCPFFLWRCEVE